MEQLAPSFDMETQRFLVQRWHSEIGQAVLAEVKAALNENRTLDAVLQPYILDHPANSDPFGYPVYPVESMRDHKFWVLATNDLRGIQVHDMKLEACQSLEHKALTYASFANCNFTQGSLGNCELSFTHIERCQFRGVNFSLSTAHKAHFESCDFHGASLWQCHIAETRLHDCDMRGVYLEDALIERIDIDYQTRFDNELCLEWNGRSLPMEQKPDLLREIRIANERAELWHPADQFLFREKRAYRKYILWPQCRSEGGWQKLDELF